MGKFLLLQIPSQRNAENPDCVADDTDLMVYVPVWQARARWRSDNELVTHQV